MLEIEDELVVICPSNETLIIFPLHSLTTPEFPEKFFPKTFNTLTYIIFNKIYKLNTKC